jgi:hypothetical protein
MFCESYRKALNEAAMSDGPLPADVQAHLASCPSCRESLSEQKALLARIEAELEACVNTQLPVSLLPRVRREIAASSAGRTWRLPLLAYAASGLAIAAIAVSFAVRTRVPSAKPEPSARAVSSPAFTQPSASKEEGDSRQVFVATSQKKRRAQQVVLNEELVVLVSAEEQIGLQRYAASLRSMPADRAANVKPAPRPEIEHLEIASIDLKGLSIDPLQGGDSD